MDNFDSGAQEYIKLRVELLQRENAKRVAIADIEALNARLDQLRRALGKSVGQNIRERCAQIDGNVLTIRYGENDAHSITVFGRNGQPV